MADFNFSLYKHKHKLDIKHETFLCIQRKLFKPCKFCIDGKSIVELRALAFFTTESRHGTTKAAMFQ
jgi:hypothetical protein